MHRNLVLPVAAAIALAAVGTAQAATKTASFNVTANVANNCVISASPLALGDFDGTNNLAATSTVAVRCTSGLAYNVELSTGSSSDFAARTMSNGTDTLVYNLYTNTSYTNIWGDGTNSTLRVAGTGNGFAADTNLTVAGRLLAAANTGTVSAGSYSDTIVASVVY